MNKSINHILSIKDANKLILKNNDLSSLDKTMVQNYNTYKAIFEGNESFSKRILIMQCVTMFYQMSRPLFINMSW